jgi:hypothetical protein
MDAQPTYLCTRAYLHTCTTYILTHLFTYYLPTHPLAYLLTHSLARPPTIATPLWPSVRMKLTLPKLGSSSPPGLPKTQSFIAGVKTPHIGVFLVSLKRSWNLDVQNGLAWAIWTSIAHVMGKRRATRSRESTRSRCALGKCNMALESSQGELPDWFRSRPNRRSGREVMMVQSLGSPNWDSFGTSLWEGVPRQKDKKPPASPIHYSLRCSTAPTPKVVASPEPGPWWVKWVQGRPWLVPTPKGCKMSSNQLVVGFGCRTV